MATSRKILLTLMSFVLAFGLMPLPAFADDAAAPEGEGAKSEATTQAAEPEVTTNATDADALDAGVQDTVPVDLATVSFVYIESPSVAANVGQNIVVGFADEGLVVESAQLELVGPDGAAVQAALSESVEGAALFAVDVSSFDPGAYEISSLTYQVAGNGATYTVSFAQDEAAAYSFEVVAAVDGASGEGGVVLETYAINSEGELVESSDIATAMADAGVDPESGPNATASDGESDSSGVSLTTQASDGFVIVLDPGHGGSDGGATGIGFLEKTVNLKIAQYCKAKLEQTPGVTVYMTRTDDTDVSLSDRTAFAVNHGADLVVSIHNNASNGSGHGSEVIVPRNGSWYYDETYVTGTELGNAILDKLTALGLTRRSVYSRDGTAGGTYPDGSLADYYSLIEGPREYGILGIIVEHAFVDNASDAAFLNNESNLKRLGEADADAIIGYYNSSSALSRIYWGVYDFDYYTSHYADVKSKYGSSKVQTLGYFKSTGMAAGQRANVLFDVNYYKAKYPDLQTAYGDDLKKYYDHFIDYGMAEGRQGSEDFNPAYYKQAYADLQAAYGNDWKAYYKHYITYGMKEGRTAVGTVSTASSTASTATQPLYRLYNPSTGEHHYTLDAHERDVIQTWGWRYEGVAWYCPSSSSIPVYRLYNPSIDLHHYTTDAHEKNVIQGWDWRYEGIAWYAVDSGNQVYRLYHPETEHHHYTTDAHERDVCVSQWGWRYEGVAWFSPFADGSTGSSSPVAANDYPIMGTSQTTVAQMVRRYNSVGKAYPSGTYTQYGASNIEQFCQILYEEAAAEGVSAEVVFAQAMHETGWLQFGGDVKANQCNFAGIGATGGGATGASFNTYGANSVRMGLRAQVQHLKAYASTASCNNAVIDPRFNLVTRGCATTVQGLSGRWATGSGYGDALVSQIGALLAS